MSLREFARRHVLHHLGLKVISLLLAAGLWWLISSEPPSEAAVKVPIVFLNMPNDLEISSETIPSAEIRVRGPERVVRRLEPSMVHAEIDLSGMKPGERTFDLTANQISLPDKLEPVQIVPSQVHLAFDTRARRRIPVRPRWVGTFATGYQVAGVQADPPAVEVVGPRKEVESIESAMTDPVDITGLTARTVIMRHAYVSDPLIQVVDPHPIRITVIMERAPATSAGSRAQ